MKRREALVIGLLIVLALCVPALILHGGMKAARDRAWRERPYEGTLADFQQEHIGLLNEAAEIFSARDLGQPEISSREYSKNVLPRLILTTKPHSVSLFALMDEVFLSTRMVLP